VWREVDVAELEVLMGATPGASPLPVGRLLAHFALSSRWICLIANGSLISRAVAFADLAIGQSVVELSGICGVSVLPKKRGYGHLLCVEHHSCAILTKIEAS